MIILIKRKIIEFFKKRGYHLVRSEEFEKKINYYRKVLEESRKKIYENKIDSIVFSKNRAMQLHAFLISFIEKVKSHGTMYILYKVTDENHRESYEEVIEIFKNEDFIFIEETNFRRQFIDICKNSLAKIIALFVDDMIFIHDLDYNHILEFDSLNYIVSLGRGKELDYSVVLKKKQKLPVFEELRNDFYQFKWDFTDEYSDWTYPIGVGGYFFSNNEINIMLNGIEFKAPNSLENNLQYYKPFFVHRYGVCKKEVTCVAVPVNIVQSESSNPIHGFFSPEELLQLWEEGWMIDLSKFYGIKGSLAQIQKYTFIKRT
jgi:hypothetical protein